MAEAIFTSATFVAGFTSAIFVVDLTSAMVIGLTLAMVIAGIEEAKVQLIMADDPKSAGPQTIGDEYATIDMAAGTINVDIVAELGAAKLQISQLLKLGRGAVVELDRRINEPVDLYVNRVRIAKAEVVVVDDHIAVTITEVLRAKH